MLRTSISGPWLQARLASTRAKKINVQLLKEPYGRRLKGEVFQVSEGHMRLKLHPEGIAAYMLPNKPPVIPILPAAEAQQIRRDMLLQAKKKAEEAAVQAGNEQRADQITTDEQQTSDRHSKVQSLLDSLDFPSVNSNNGATTSASKADLDSASASEMKTEATDKQFEWQNDLVVNITNRK